jgi:hypothetical protein
VPAQFGETGVDVAAYRSHAKIGTHGKQLRLAPYGGRADQCTRRQRFVRILAGRNRHVLGKDERIARVLSWQDASEYDVRREFGFEIL